MVQSFTRSAPAPDPASTLAAIRAVIGDPFTVAPTLNSDGSIVVVVDKPSDWTPTQTTNVQAAITSAPAATKALAQQADMDALSPTLLGIFLTILDEVNVLRGELNTIRAALSPPLTPALPTRTAAQFRTAARNKAGTL